MQHFTVGNGDIVSAPQTRKQKWLMRISLVSLALGAAIAAMILATPKASADPANCQSQFWLTLGANTRVICDGPIRPDGSWERARAFYTPAHYVRGSGYCSRYGGCTYSEGYYQETTVKSRETYIVTPDTVLPDEPGHLG